MKGIVRDIFPGGNTPKGFYSFYKYILPQEIAEHIFIIKGGPGVGKSTMMKNIANYFIAKGEDVDMFWCSADPDSLDGLLLKDRNISLVDGTAPHIIDPINPGAVDEIVDLGQSLNRDKLRKQKADIIKCSNEISRTFNNAYSHLKDAVIKYNSISDMCDEASIKDIDKLMKLIDSKCIGFRTQKEEKRFFSCAITYKGIIDHTHTLVKGIDNIFCIDGQLGMKTENIIMPMANKLINYGFDVELYYSPMCPDTRIEHMVSKDADIAIITINNIYKDFAESELTNVFESLKKAKQLHDELEKYYYFAIDFNQVEETTCKLIKTIEE